MTNTKMKKCFVAFCIIIFFIITLAIVIFAHSGGTDSHGGHYDRTTGKYHYHHGYSAHRHYDMDGDGDIDCPYTFKDSTNHGSGNSNNSTNHPSENANNKVTASNIIGKIFAIIGLSAFVLLVGFSTTLLQGIHWLMMYPIKHLSNKFCKEDSREKVLDKFSIIITILIISVVITIVSTIILQ